MHVYETKNCCFIAKTYFKNVLIGFGHGNKCIIFCMKVKN